MATHITHSQDGLHTTIENEEEYRNRKKKGCLTSMLILGVIGIGAFMDAMSGDKTSDSVKPVQSTSVQTTSPKTVNSVQSKTYESPVTKTVVDVEPESPSTYVSKDDATPSISVDDLDRLKEASKPQKADSSEEQSEDTLDSEEEIKDAIGLYSIAVAYIKEDDLESAQECLAKMEAVQSSLSKRSNKLDSKIESLRQKLAKNR